MLHTSLVELTPYDAEKDCWHVVVETPKGSHNKYKYEEKLGGMMLATVLPEGMAFPYDFGFLPQTLGDDGDPLDVLLLMDEPAFPGCIIPARLIGVIEARQTEKGKRPEQNHRLVAIPIKCRLYDDCKRLKDLNPTRVHEIERFFISYNKTRDKVFKVTSISGPRRAEKIARTGIQQWRAR